MTKKLGDLLRRTLHAMPGYVVILDVRAEGVPIVFVNVESAGDYGHKAATWQASSRCRIVDQWRGALKLDECRQFAVGTVHRTLVKRRNWGSLPIYGS
jgi:hypothetical protein